MKTRITCRSQKELALYFSELLVYFKKYGSFPQETGEDIALPGVSITRIRYDKFPRGGAVQILIDWAGGEGR